MTIESERRRLVLHTPEVRNQRMLVDDVRVFERRAAN